MLASAVNMESPSRRGFTAQNASQLGEPGLPVARSPRFSMCNGRRGSPDRRPIRVESPKRLLVSKIFWSGRTNRPQALHAGPALEQSECTESHVDELRPVRGTKSSACGYVDDRRCRPAALPPLPE